MPLQSVPIPYPCSDEDRESRMGAFVDQCKGQGVEYFTFGDLYLEDVRKYREEKLKETEVKPLFPLREHEARSPSKKIASAVSTIQVP